MGETLGKLFVDVTPMDKGGGIPDDGYGMVQLLFLGCIYGYVLYVGSGYIGDGAEELELIDSIKGIVGALIIPILGAVPDGAIVLFSGMGDNAKEELDVGVGALAGSTIMLLTLPWFLSIYAGRVDLDEHGKGKSSYATKKHQRLVKCEGMTKEGVECSGSVRKTGILMVITMLPYVLIQIAAFGYDCYHKDDTNKCSGEGNFPLVGLIISIVFFLGYCWFQVNEANIERADDESERKGQTSSQKELAYRVKQKMMEKGITIWKVHKDDFDELARDPHYLKQIRDASFNTNCQRILETEAEEYEEGQLMKTDTRGADAVKDMKLWKNPLMRHLKHMFNEINTQDSSIEDAFDEKETLDAMELGIYFSRFDKGLDQKLLTSLFFEFDLNKSGTINFSEFVLCMLEYHKRLHGYSPSPEGGSDVESQSGVSVCDEEVESDSDVLKHALKTLTIGTVLILLFSDPMCAVLSEIGSRTGIPAFYISFVVAPLASNGAEIIVAYNFAARKTKESVSASFNTLLGAACMNNTFCLGIFMAIIAFSPSSKQIYWEYAGETVVIIFAELILFYFALSRKHNMRDAYLVLMVYPLTIAMVAAIRYGAEMN